MIFAERRPFDIMVSNEREANWLDRYLDGRKRYKGELVEALASLASTGPVLELNDGFGLATEFVAQRRVTLWSACRDERARQRYERALGQWNQARHCTLIDRRDLAALDPGRFKLVYSVNALHAWDHPLGELERAYRLVAPGGWLMVNDLRRDADPFITEYVVREFADEEGEESAFHLRVFLRSLQAAWSLEEVRALAARGAFDSVAVEAHDAMTLTLRIGKRGG